MSLEQFFDIKNIEVKEGDFIKVHIDDCDYALLVIQTPYGLGYKAPDNSYRLFRDGSSFLIVNIEDNPEEFLSFYG